MIINIENNSIIFENKNPIEIERTSNQQKNVKEFWHNFKKENNECYNGNVYCITSMSKQDNKIIFEIGKTRFEDIVYAKEHSDFKTRCLFVATYFITIDGYYCVIKNNRNIVNLIGGMADDYDFEEEIFNPIKNLSREIGEELGLNISSEDFMDIKLKYLKIPSEKEENFAHYPIGLIYETKLNITYNELTNKFSANKKIIDGEIREIIAIKEKEVLNNYEKKASYLIELFECIKNC